MITRSVRHRISSALAYPFLRLQKRYILRRRLPAVPLSAWHRLPFNVQEWFSRTVLKPSETYAWEQVHADRDLGRLAEGVNNRWALSPASRLYLWQFIHERQPTRILDFGSGQSTLIFCTYAAEMAARGHEVRVCSIEHDAAWASHLRSLLEERGLGRYVTIIEAPLTSQFLLQREMMAYSVAPALLEEVAAPHGFELCLVDGPPGNVGRAGSLAIAARFLAEGATVFLDDALRQKEFNVVQEWRRAWPHGVTHPCLLMADRHGLAAMQWHKH